MPTEVSGHRVLVFGDEDTALKFRPPQDGFIVAPQRQVRRVPNSLDIQAERGRKVAPLNRIPKRPTKMLVQQVRQRHGGQSSGACSHFHLVQRFQPGS
jgi:hypothetical protein